MADAAVATQPDQQTPAATAVPATPTPEQQAPSSATTTPTTPTTAAPATPTQPWTHPNATVAMMSPDQKSVKMVPPDQQDDAKSAGWEPAVKMTYNQSVPFQSIPFGTKKWVPASQLEDARKENWLPVLTDQQRAAVEADSIKPSVSGNLGIMLAPLAVPEEVAAAGEEAVGKYITEPLINAGEKYLQQPAADALEGAKNYVYKKLAEQSPELFGDEAVKATLKKLAMESLKKATTGSLVGGGIALGHKIIGNVWDEVFGTGTGKK